MSDKIPANPDRIALQFTHHGISETVRGSDPRAFLHFVGPSTSWSADGRTGIETFTTHYDDRDEIVTAYPDGRVERQTKRRPTPSGSGPASR